MNSSPKSICGSAGTSSATSIATTGSSGGLQFPGMPNTFSMQPGPLQQLQQLNESLKSEPGQDAVPAAPLNHVQTDAATYGYYAGAYPGAAYLPVANAAYAYLNHNALPMHMWQQAQAYANQFGQTKKSGSSTRQTYARWQTEILETCFRGNEYVTKKKREDLHAATGLSDRQIKIWFQNRRMKKKKENKREKETTRVPGCNSRQSPSNSNGRPPPPCTSGNLTVKREAAFTSDAPYHDSSASLASPKSDDVPDVKDYKLPETIPNSLSYANAGNQKKKGRETYKPYQVNALESTYRESQYVSKQQRAHLIRITHLEDRQIKIWFQNRRMKEKKEKQQKEAGIENGTPVPPNPPRNGNPSHIGPSTSTTRAQPEAVSAGVEGGRTGVSDNEPVELANFANQAAIPPELSIQYSNPYVHPQMVQYPYSGFSYYANA